LWKLHYILKTTTRWENLKPSLSDNNLKHEIKSIFIIKKEAFKNWIESKVSDWVVSREKMEMKIMVL
jgi:hypothetical protein